MPRAESRPARFTQLDFDSLATVTDDIQAADGTERNGHAVQLPDVQPLSGTGRKFVLRPGGIQYTLDAMIAQSAQEGREATDEEGAGRDGSRQDAVQPFSGTGNTYSLVPGGRGIQYTLDALFGRSDQAAEAETSDQAESKRT